MSQSSSKLTLPYLQAAQAQKHVTHNEALERLDMLVQLTVLGFGVTTPPVSAVEGDVWALGTGAQGAWTGHDNELAGWYNGGWLFIVPAAGWRAAQDLDLRVWSGTDWTGSEAPDFENLASVGINAVSDTTNRLAVSADATLLNHDGAGHQLKLNKAGPSDTASLLYQTGFSGRVEMGTAGNDDFTIKVSADGATWSDALVARGTDGWISLPAGANLADGTAAAPSLAFSEQTGSGIWRTDSDEIGVSTGSVERVRVTSAGMQVSGRITGTAVTQSHTDQTAGRLLQTGDFGLGEAITLTAADDLSGLVASGLYYNPTGGNCAGNNYPIISAGVVMNQRRTGTNWVQQFISYGGNSSASGLRQFTRSYGTLGWTPWLELMHQGRVVGAVSQSGGVPTGAVIERGANANGSYVRWADGTQICTLKRDVSLAINLAYLGGFRCTTQTWVFPAPFEGGTDTVLSGSALDGTGFSVIFEGATGASQTGWNVTAITTQTAASRSVTLSATGRWF